MVDPVFEVWQTPLYEKRKSFDFLFLCPVVYEPGIRLNVISRLISNIVLVNFIRLGFTRTGDMNYIREIVSSSSEVKQPDIH